MTIGNYPESHAIWRNVNSHGDTDLLPSKPERTSGNGFFSPVLNASVLNNMKLCSWLAKFYWVRLTKYKYSFLLNWTSGSFFFWLGIRQDRKLDLTSRRVILEHEAPKEYDTLHWICQPPPATLFMYAKVNNYCQFNIHQMTAESLLFPLGYVDIKRRTIYLRCLSALRTFPELAPFLKSGSTQSR